MNEIVINYKENKGQKILSFIVGIYLIVVGGYFAVSFLIEKVYDVHFILGLIAVIFGLALILKVTLFAPKPVFMMNSETIYSNVATKPQIFKTDWTNIKNVAIGLSYLRITETTGKEYNVDLSQLKYSDLKDIKSRIIEYCEAKVISYQND